MYVKRKLHVKDLSCKQWINKHQNLKEHIRYWQSNNYLWGPV